MIITEGLTEKVTKDLKGKGTSLAVSGGKIFQAEETDMQRPCGRSLPGML
jgi:hypothetical protein